MRTLEVVVGAQFGSEAKGHVVQRLTERAQATGMPPQVLRVAGPNAGHTGYSDDGTPWALRQVPVAAVTQKSCTLGITAGSEIDLPVLLDEFDRLRDAGLLANKFLWVSEEATMIYDLHKEEENMPSVDGGGRVQEGTDLVGRIGSTGKGIGAARAARLMRNDLGKRLKDDKFAMRELEERGIAIASAEHIASSTYNHVIIEGTQGYGLGLHAGYYPQCTSSDCRAQDFIAMAGVAPWQFNEVKVWAVARMYPIRVAGNSGPLKDETTWEALNLPEERTTVTKKVRRVGLPDWDLVARAVRANGGAPTVRLAVTMVDQMFPGTRDKTGKELGWDGDWKDYIERVIERETGAEVQMFTTGPNTATIAEPW